MLIVALTGGIATGKSIVARVLGQKGCFIQEADELAHQLLIPGSQVWIELVRHFGQKILEKDETINRKVLAEIIFKDPKERDFLNNLTHPLILEKVKQTILRLEEEGLYDIYITVAALVIESGYYKFYDRIILTFCQPEIQIQRLCERDGLPPEKAIEKIRAQMPDQEKIPFAHYLIDTSGTLEKTIDQTEKVYLYLYQDVSLKKTGLLI
ncbi:MAG: dephospho-CoA kinase [Candidatus Saccharicenans sp.]